MEPESSSNPVLIFEEGKIVDLLSYQFGVTKYTVVESNIDEKYITLHLYEYEDYDSKIHMIDEEIMIYFENDDRFVYLRHRDSDSDFDYWATYNRE